MAWRTVAASSAALMTITAAPTSPITVEPGRSGRYSSSSTRSGDVSAASRTASAAVCAVPTTSNPGTRAQYDAWTRATRKSSSTTSTRIT